MSSDQMENQAKTKLAILVKSIEPIVEEQVADFTPAEVEYVLANFRKFATVMGALFASSSKWMSPAEVEIVTSDI